MGQSSVTKVFILTLLLLPSFATAQIQADSDPDSAVVKDFEQRVSDYVSLQKKQGAPRQTQSNSAAQVTQQKHDTRQKIKQARAAATQGEIFTPEITAYFKKQIQATLSGPDGKKVQASLRRAEPLPNVPLEVNHRYPPNLPLQSTPPSLLANLPKLPKGLQYRLVGTTLVLYDESSSLIVDLITGAMS